MAQQEKETMQIFKHGNEAVFPTTAFGPSLYGILEGAWMLPMILKGIRSEIWKQSVPAGTPHLDPITTSWLKLGLVEPDWPEGEKGATTFPLTENGERVVACAGLLEYEFSMMEQQLNGSLVTDPAKYAALRDGLAEYSKRYLPDVFGWLNTLMQNHITEWGPELNMGSKLKVMDYCGGKGQYLKHIMEKFSCVEGHLVDKRANEADIPRHARRHPFDVMTPNFQESVVDGWQGEFDLIIMSECLHCVDEEGRKKMIAHAYNLLRLGGTLVILEQFPNMRLDWRLFDLSHGGGVMTMDQVAYEVQYLPLKPTNTIEAISHYGISFMKEEPKEDA